MPKTRTIALAVALVALSTAAVAQTHARATHRAAPQPAPTGGYSYQSYGLEFELPGPPVRERLRQARSVVTSAS